MRDKITVEPRNNGCHGTEIVFCLRQISVNAKKINDMRGPRFDTRYKRTSIIPGFILAIHYPLSQLYVFDWKRCAQGMLDKWH